MDRSEFVIIGGVACGPKTAATLARRLPGASITLFQKEERLSYATCGLPYFASGDVGSLNELESTSYGQKRDADFFEKTKGFEVVTGAEVTAINRADKTITVKELRTGKTYEHGYGKLVIATGAMPVKPPFPVADAPSIRSFTRPDDALDFRKLAEQGKIEKAVIIGGGFIGCELAEAAGGLWGIDVTLIEKEPQVLPYALDPEMAAIVEREIRRHGIHLRTAMAVREILVESDNRPVVVLNDGERVSADFVFVCVGVRPNAALAKACSLEIGATGGIVVNSRMQTSDPDIYAGGDCVESVHQLTEKPLYLPMGSLANRHGRVIAENLAGNEAEFSGVLGAFLVKVFELNVGAVGLSARAARYAGITANEVWGSFPDKPDYYPDSKTFVLKMTYSTDGKRLLGLQAVGAGDICRRIDVFSSFLQRKGAVDDLLTFEHGYAPPYAEALDPLHHLAAMAQAQMKGFVFLSPDTDLAVLSKEAVLLDVREPGEFTEEPLAADLPVINIPLGELRARIDELDAQKRTVVVCKRGSRSYQAALILRAAGFRRVELLAGGLQSLL
jgi:NADPH-dependent 2,4-dienoyl-CoA reductase/sulfur reductase-like enzyme/rhodanese-related sulfurtransferase